MKFLVVAHGRTYQENAEAIHFYECSDSYLIKMMLLTTIYAL